MPHKTHTSKVAAKSENDVFSTIGNIAITAVYTPAIIANIINFSQISSIPPNIFLFSLNILHIATFDIFIISFSVGDTVGKDFT